ncbi:MAG: hypothetical protein PHS62_05215, partial [Patescibacteria group bacterium]|nr:hypothetical protein [Patescibacteria group bacterium]
FGYLFKEAWKSAYSDEPTPRFYRINPRSVTRTHMVPQNLEKFQDYLSRRIDDKNAKVIIFDEAANTGMSAATVMEFLSGEGGEFNRLFDDKDYPENRKAYKNFKEDVLVPIENIYIYPGLVTLRSGAGPGYQGMLKYDAEIKPAVKVTQKDFHRSELTSRTIKDPAKRKEALKYISELKSVGQEIGEEIKQEKLNKK